MSPATRIAKALGDARPEGHGWRCRCPLHGGRSLVLADGRDRRLLVKCWGGGCDARDILAELRRLRLLAGRGGGGPTLPEPRSSSRDDTARRSALARRVWDAAADVRGSPVVRYLAGRAIITLPLPPSLRWAPALRRLDGAYAPAMVARVNSLDGELLGAHRTWLTRDESGQWRRRDRASLGPVGGGAVRLAPAAETLLIGEGVETCLAAMQATGMPAWAALSTSGMVALVLPASVRTVIILADHDRSGAGERAARAAAQRWLAEGRRVRLALPPEPGTDFADVLAHRRYARIAEVCNVAA